MGGVGDVEKVEFAKKVADQPVQPRRVSGMKVRDIDRDHWKQVKAQAIKKLKVSRFGLLRVAEVVGGVGWSWVVSAHP